MFIVKKCSNKMGVSIFLGLLLLSGRLVAQDESIINLSLEDLMDIEVTSVGKRAQPIATAASAVFVITGEDIRRSGVTTIPDALRMAPGVQVGQIDTNKWAISARGFNTRLANKLLVLIDGRTVYSPTFSGVYWENQDLVIEDIARIEVIRGSGATLWGSNAVNGVINITTRSAAVTRGSLISATVSDNDGATLSLRYGDKLTANADYRVYARFNQIDDMKPVIPQFDSDSQKSMRIGFRIDGSLGNSSSFSLQGESFESDANQDYIEVNYFSPLYGTFIPTKVEQSGSHLLGRWIKESENGGVLTSQVFYDYFERKEEIQDEAREIYDLDIQYQFPRLANHALIIGGGYRQEHHDTTDTFSVQMDPAHLDSEITNFFIQDEMFFLDNNLSVIVGAKFESNEFSSDDLVFQPSFRMSYKLSDDHAFWGAISRSARIFSRGERDGKILIDVVDVGDPTNPYPIPLFGYTLPRESMEPEQMTSFELGYRGRVTEKIVIDVALFSNDYENLRSAEVLTDIMLQPGYLEFYLLLGNESEAESKGIEIAAEFLVSEQWKVAASYSYISMDNRFIGGEPPTEAPKNQVSLQTQYSFSKAHNLNLQFRYVDEVPFTNISSYSEMDLTYQWDINENLKFSLSGRNLLNDSHNESIPDLILTAPMLVRRSIVVGLSASF